MPRERKVRAPNRYAAMIEAIFQKHHVLDCEGFEFTRAEFEGVAAALKIVLPKNLGDVIYAMRYRTKLPASIATTAAQGLEWIIEGAGSGKYRFRQVRLNRIVPRADLVSIKIPDATPALIAEHALGDEQALLARVRYNRLVDIFLGITTYSLQNHLRTTVSGVGQIEIDEVYVGVDKHGRQFVVPVQARGGSDKHGVVQTQQDMACCEAKFPQLICRPVSAQFMADERIALFELTLQSGDVKVVSERHYPLVPASAITPLDLQNYSRRSVD